MKKLIEKIKSVGWDKWSKILIGFLVLAILWTMFFALRAKAADVVPGDLSQYYQFIPYDDWNLGAADVSSDYHTMTVYYNSTSEYKQSSIWIVARDSNIDAFSASLYNLGTYVDYVSLVSDTSFPSYYYNIFKASFFKDSNYINISVPWDYTSGGSTVDIYGLYVFSYSDYVTDVEEYINSVVSNLNSFPDYITNIQTITANGDQINVLTTVDNSGILYEEQVYTGSTFSIRVVGQIATTEGVDHYTGSVGSDSIGTLSNSSSDQSVTTDFVNYVNSSELNIYDYDHNAVFDLTLDLSDYVYQTVPVTINAHSNDGSVRFLVGIINVSVYSPEDPPPEESDSETESESVPGADSGTDSPGEIETDDGSFDEGYLAGYEQALRDQQIGVFGQATLDAYFHFTHSEGIDIPILVKFSVDPSSGSIDFLQVWNWYSSSMYNHPDYTLVDIELDILFPSGFKWEEGIMFVSFSPEYSASASWLPYNTEAFSVEHEDGAMLNINYGVMTGKNRWYLTQPSGYTNSDLSIDMIRFDINDKNITYEDFFATYRFTLHTNISTYTVQTYSYNQGYNDGWNRGSDSGYKEGFNRAYDLGYEEGHEFAFSQGYNEAKDVYYEEGKKAGIFIGKQEAPEDYQFYDLFYSVFDAPLAVLRTTFNFEIFGVNIAGFLLGLFTLLLAHKAIKLVI